MSSFLLPVQYLRQIAEQLRVMGLAPEHWLTSCGVAPEQLNDPDYQPDIALLIQLVERAMTLSNEPAFGLLLGERLVVGTHGVLGFAALQAASLRQVIELLEQYLPVRTTLVNVQLQPTAQQQFEQLRFVPAHALGAAEQTIIEAITLAVKNIFDAIGLGDSSVHEVSLPFPPPAYARLASNVFGCPVRYQQPCAAFSLNSALLDKPLRMADPDAFREAEQICQRELTKLGDRNSLGDRVQRLLLERQSSFPSLETTARLLYLTPRTLHRRLQSEHTSYKQILRDVRHALAIEHLKSGRLSVEEIAWALGYSDVANFRRAFRQWEGVAPSAYRQQ
ncbi:AraC family transcriptional regulator [Halopseudomonas maritima]|uniref:AraC family transcriptional regulator n=1 Tax=Halopseudomonas maritima TaxID=2918528 RepID=UPI001EEA1C2F|nr:AraC family transcriptional regulator [Halopseudomonas maritima]UJJ31983.1 AraC family transcriptional regulator [Halopseudomonas maritima]